MDLIIFLFVNPQCTLCFCLAILTFNPLKGHYHLIGGYTNGNRQTGVIEVSKAKLKTHLFAVVFHCYITCFIFTLFSGFKCAVCYFMYIFVIYVANLHCTLL